jgi:hypothetical protein
MSAVTAGSPADSGERRPGRRMGTRDRTWLEVDNLRTIGPLRGMTAEGLRQTLIRLHDRHSDYRAVCLLDRDGTRWVPLSGPDFAAFSQNLVVRVDATDGADPADAVTRRLVDEPLGDRPLLLAVSGGFVGAKISHAVGDGRIVNTLFPELLRATAEGRTPRPPFPSSTRLPLVRAALHHFGRHPSRLVPAARILRPPPSAETGAALPWRARVRYGSARSGHALAQVRAWRDNNAPGVSAAAVLFASASAALARCGLTPKWPGAVVLYDVRRYLPRGSTVDGNFSWGQYLLPESLTDPRALHRALSEEFASGRPLAMLALRTARLMLSGTRPTGPVLRAVPAHPRPELTLTHIGRIDQYLDLPWAGPPEQWRNMSVPTTSGPEAITLSFSELAGALYLNASFDSSTFDPDRVLRVIDLICQDPVGLVDSTAGASGHHPS